MRSPAADLVVLDTLGKLYAHGHGLFGCSVVTSSVREWRQALTPHKAHRNSSG
jgi:hypothetical protein